MIQMFLFSTINSIKSTNKIIICIVIFLNVISLFLVFHYMFSDVHSAVTLKVSPDRVQHFTSDSVSLSCEGNFTKRRVRSFPENRYRSDCYYWRSMTESTCNIYSYQQSDAVYWCESESGEFSNAVNITIQSMFSLYIFYFHLVFKLFSTQCH